MKKTVAIIFLCAFISAQAQRAVFTHCAFSTPDNKPYIETYLSIDGKSVSFRKNKNGKYQGDVEVGIIFSKNGNIAASKKYNLLSPEQNDTLTRPAFVDEQRFPLDTGEYEVELMLKDKNKNGKTVSMKEKTKIDFPQDKVTVSGIEMLSSFAKAEKTGTLTKNGFDLVPYTNIDFYPGNINEISFYAEIYNTKKILGENEKFLLTYYIETNETKMKLEKYAVAKKEIASPVNVLLSKFNIENLQSGNYNMVIEVRSKNNEPVAQKKVFFQRQNAKAKEDLAKDLSGVMVENTFASKFTKRDSLSEFIRTVRPISTEAEKSFIDNQLKLAELKLLQQFFYNFWQTRNPLSPEQAWNTYYQDVKTVNKKFGNFIYKGYETDMGRVYLQYGPPDTRDESPSEPNAYPYEIWTYYTLEDRSKLNPNQTKRKFVFYNPELVANNYQLLHSDALSELHDANWDMKLHKRMTQSNDMEQLNAPDHFGGNAHDEFNNPR
ncbi:MAG: GWxTD domain-containing protein [Bacteroidetes bacterium]|nr:GWxTD domain-containing protein [Bacteroidota bacterium]